MHTPMNVAALRYCHAPSLVICALMSSRAAMLDLLGYMPSIVADCWLVFVPELLSGTLAVVQVA
jgi:hypothetical protein